jgi:hypothetical protein
MSHPANTQYAPHDCGDTSCEYCAHNDETYTTIVKDIQREIDRDIIRSLIKEMEQENDTLEWLIDE